MELIVKPKNIVNLDKYIKMGANAFLFGLKNFSVCQTSVINSKSLLYLRKKIKKEIKIYISIDLNVFNKDIKKLKKALQEIDEVKIDGIFFYDLAIIQLCHELDIKTPLIWNQNYFVTNYETCNYYQRKGVVGAVISSEITLDEINTIAKNTSINLYINAFGYQMMSYSKRKLLSSYFYYLKRFNLKKYHYIINDDKKYLIKEEKNGTCFLSPDVLNTLKEINDFRNNKIYGLILDEKMIKTNYFLNIIDIYSKASNKKFNSNELENLNKKINSLIPNCSSGFLYKSTIYQVKKNEK